MKTWCLNFPEGASVTVSISLGSRGPVKPSVVHRAWCEPSGGFVSKVIESVGADFFVASSLLWASQCFLDDSQLCVQ